MIVTVCGVAQLLSVKVSGPDTVALLSSLLMGMIVTLLPAARFGTASNTTV